MLCVFTCGRLLRELDALRQNDGCRVSLLSGQRHDSPAERISNSDDRLQSQSDESLIERLYNIYPQVEFHEFQ